MAAAAGAFQVAIAAPPAIDPGFGNGQPVVTDFGAEAAAAAGSGKVIVVGRSGGADGPGGAVLEVRNPTARSTTRPPALGR